MKKILLTALLILFVSTIVSAQTLKTEFPNGDEFEAGSKITLKVNLFDEQNRPITGSRIELIIEDAEKTRLIEDYILSGEIKEIELGSNTPSGFWTIKAKYQEVEENSIFSIKENQEVKFEINGDILTITNIGNTRYDKTIQIMIGDTVGIKRPDLRIGESISFRLIAPEGIYNVRVTDGSETISRNNVRLTGEVIGIVDERISEKSPITGGGNKRNNLAFVFVFAVIGSAILLTIERHYRKKR